ncbi:MAG: hypothetical protein LBC23_03260, partial [Coriobacteriales bacterium]|nr:hypothetical protein [Coriobacteriales bacterium]
MLDSRFVRENITEVQAALRNRGMEWDSGGFLELEGGRRSVIAELESLQARRNTLSKEVGELMRAAKGASKGGATGDDASAQAEALRQAEEAKAEVRDLNIQIEQAEQRK